MKKLLAATSIAISLVSAVILPSCDINGLNAGDSGSTGIYSSQKAIYSKFNTTASLVVTDNFNDDAVTDKLKSLSKDVNNYLGSLESSLSTSVESSYISLFNAADAGATVEIDEMTYTVLSLACDMYEFTQGYYNPAVYYSVDLYGFTPRFSNYTGYADISTKMLYDRTEEVNKTTYVTRGIEPDEHYVEIFRDLASHFGEIELKEEGGRYYAVKPDYTVEGLYGDTYSLAIDLGGIGKGYAVDAVSAIMSSYGFEYGFFEFGKSSYSIKGSRDQSGNWNMSISDPSTMGWTDFAQLELSNICLSTSGDYEKAYSIGDTTYCHIINPMTGSPIQTGIASCTITGRTSAEDDALTTALSAMGKERAVQFINENLSDMQVVMMMRNADGSCTDIITNCPDEIKVTSGRIINTVSDGKIIL